MRTIPDNPTGAEQASVIKTASTGVTLIVAVLLAIAKLAGWLVTGSMALLASAIDAAVDTGASIVTLLGVRYAQRPPDRDHRFGHGKGEAVAAFTQSTFLAGAAVVLAIQSIQRLVFPVPLDALEIGFWLIGASLLAALGLAGDSELGGAQNGFDCDRRRPGALSCRHRPERRGSSRSCCDPRDRMDPRRPCLCARHLGLHAMERL